MAKGAGSSESHSLPKRTVAQEEAFKKALEDQLKHEREGKMHALKVAFRRGQIAHRVISAEKRELFGDRTVEEVAVHLGVKRLTMCQSMKFAELINKNTLKALCDMPCPPSWRMMSKWVGIKDEKRRAVTLKDILSGRLGANGFDDNLRQALDRGPKKTRRPAGGAATFRKIGAEAETFTEHLGWIPKAFAEIDRLSDPIASREAKTVVREAVDVMKSTLADLKQAIEDCEKLV